MYFIINITHHKYFDKNINENMIKDSKSGINDINEYYFLKDFKKMYGDSCILFENYFRIIITPNYSKNNSTHNSENMWSSYAAKLKTSKIILSDKYYLYDIKTIKKFKLKITPSYIAFLCMNNHIEILDWLKENGLLVRCNSFALSTASSFGRIGVLNWWVNSGLPFEYSEWALDWASGHGEIKTLDW